MNHVASNTPDFDSAADLASLHGMLEAIQVKNGWSKPTPSIYPEPKQRFVPAHWRYADARAALHVAGRLVGTEWAERRNLILANPIPGNDYPTVSSLVAAYQMVKGGETARSHRHTPNAMRIVVEAGPDTCTIVDGVDVPMAPGDVLLTPNWSFHGHNNRSAQEAYWIDILDAPLVQLLGPMFFEPHPDGVEKAHSLNERSSMRFAYADYRPKVLAAPEVARGVRALELGPPRLPTFDRLAIHLAEDSAWALAPTTASQIYVVIEGSGQSTIGDKALAWARGDVIAAPAWMRQRHASARGAVLMRMSDAPLMKAFDWLREGRVAA